MGKLKQQCSAISGWMTTQASGKTVVKIVFSSTIIAALIAHLFCWTNTMFSHDSLLIIQSDQISEIAYGRPFQHLYLYLRGLVVAPWLVGVLGTLYLTLSNLIICKVLDIRSRGFVIALCSIMATSPFVTLLNATYITWYDVYMLALLLSCLAVLICKSRWYGWMIGVPLICFSMGLYPAYLQVAIVLIATMGLVELLRNKGEFHGLFYAKTIFMLILGALLYLLAVKGVQDFMGIAGSTGYNSPTSAFQFNESILRELLTAWFSPLSYLLFPETHAVRASGLANLLLMLFLFVTIVRLCAKNRLRIGQIVLVTLIMIFMPLLANIIGFAAANNVHSLMIYSYYLFYAIVFASLEVKALSVEEFAELRSGNGIGKKGCGFKKTIGGITIILVLLMSMSNVIYANQVYLKKELEYQTTLSIMTDLEGRLETIPGYIPGKTPVAFSGSLAYNPYYSGVRKGFPPGSDQASFGAQERYTGYSIGLGADISIYNFTQMSRYYEYVLGRPIMLATVEGLSDSKKAPLESMPVYPVDGSIVVNEGVVLVKLS